MSASGSGAGGQMWADYFDALLSTSHLLWSAKDPRLAFDHIAAFVGKATDWRGVAIALLAENGQTLHVRGAYGETESSPYRPGLTIAAGSIEIDLASLKRGYAVILDSWAIEHLFSPPGPVVAFPINGRTELYGALLVAVDHVGASAHTPETRLCKSLVEQIGAALDVAGFQARHEQHLARAAAQAALVQMVVDERGLAALTAALADMIGNPVMISDGLFHLLAVSPNQDRTDRMRQECISQGGIPRQALDDPHMRQQFQRIAQLRSPVTLASFPAHGWVQRRIQAPIRMGEDILGWFAVAEAQRPFSDADYAILREATAAFGLDLMKRQAALEAEHRLQADFLRDLLSAQPSDKGSIMARASFLGIDLLRPWELLVAELDDASPPLRDDDPTAHAAAHRRVHQVVSRVVRQHHAQGVVVLHRESVLVLVPSLEAGSAGAGRAANAIREEIARISLHGTVSVGIGGRCERIEDFAPSYRQARRALDVVRSLGQADRAASLNDLGVYGILFRSDDPSELVRFADRKLGRLLEYDAQHGDTLVDTLNAYLDENCKHRQAAARLFVHVNTLSGRLRRIAAVGGFDLDDAATRFDLQLALRVRRLTPAHPPVPSVAALPATRWLSTDLASAPRRSGRRPTPPAGGKLRRGQGSRSLDR